MICILKDKIIDSIANKNNMDRFSTSIGEIIKYYQDLNKVDVLVESDGVKNITLEKIPMPSMSKGIKSIPPKVGDKVLVSFTNNSALQGKVISLVDDNYQYTQNNFFLHLNSGAYNLSIDIDSLDVKEYDTPLSEYWIDEDNTEIVKYYGHVKNSPISDLISDVGNVCKFSGDDLGFIHPTNKSIVKINENGEINIYTADNFGVNINPFTKTISINSSNISNKSDNWVLKSNLVNFECKEFNVVSDSITLDAKTTNILGINSD